MSNSRYADLVLFGSSIITMESQTESAALDGIAISSGRVLAVGDRATLEPHIGESTRVLDLPGAVVMPGFVDSHIHPVFGLDLTRGAEQFSDASRVVINSDGKPTGYLLEVQAIALVEKRVPELTFEQRAESLFSVLTKMADAGFTGGQVQDLAPGTLDLLRHIEATRDLPIRLRLSPWFEPGTAIDEVDRLEKLQGTHGRDWLVQGVKMMIDGTIDNGTAWLHEPDCLGESTRSLWLAPEQYRQALSESMPAAFRPRHTRSATRASTSSLRRSPRSPLTTPRTASSTSRR